MPRDNQAIARNIAMQLVRESLPAGYFFLPTKMRLMFRDWNTIDDIEKQRRVNFLKNTPTSQTKRQDFVSERKDQQDTLITRTDGESISVITRSINMYPAIFVPSEQTMAEVLKTDDLQENLEAYAALPEDEFKLNALFAKFSFESLASKYPEGSEAYSTVEDALIKQSTAPAADDEREDYRNDVIWQDIELDRCYDLARALCEPLSALEEKIQKFETTDTRARDAIRTMQQQLTSAVKDYVNGTLDNGSFYNQCNVVIDAARKPLAKHRGCAGIFSGLTRALSNFAAFFGFRTDSAKKLDALKEELAALTGHPSPEAQRTEEFFERLGNFDMQEDLSPRGPGRSNT